MAGRKSTKTAPVEPMETMGSAIKALMEEKGISEDLVFSTVESIIKDAYKQQYKPYENCVVRWNDAHDNIDVFVQKTVVDGEQYGVIDPIEISLEDARRLDPQCDIGDELLIPFNPKNLKRQSIQQARTDARKSFRSITNDKQYNEYKNKEGQLIKGYFLRQMPNGDIWVNIGTIEGLLPNRNQSPRENYDGYGVNDSILCYVESVKEDDHGVHVILSRTHSELVRKLFELQIPEIQQQQIDIVKVVRMAGMRTKVAVVSRNENIDPIGACIGLQGNRIKTIMDEIEGERIDIVRYDSNPVNYIRNALAPAEVKDIVVIDKNVFQAVAIVDKSQQALAIGKQGVNVRLASKLCDWMIEVKTQEEFDEMDISQAAREKAESIFGGEEQGETDVQQPAQTGAAGISAEPAAEDNSGVPEDEVPLADLPLDEKLLKKLQFHDIYSVEDFISLTPEDQAAMTDLSAEDIAEIKKVISENIDIVEDENEETEYVCPNCGQPVTPDMKVCPHCGTGLSFEEV